MPIVSVHAEPFEHIVQACAMCRRAQAVDVSMLEVGSPRQDGSGNPAVIMLPPCACGAVEGVFVRSDQDFSGDDRAAVHGRTVIALGARLAALGLVHPSCAGLIEASPAPPLAPVTIPPPW
jgi:hypothetical protein